MKKIIVIYGTKFGYYCSSFFSKKNLVILFDNLNSLNDIKNLKILFMNHLLIKYFKVQEKKKKNFPLILRKT